MAEVTMETGVVTQVTVPPVERAKRKVLEESEFLDVFKQASSESEGDFKKFYCSFMIKIAEEAKKGNFSVKGLGSFYIMKGKPTKGDGSSRSYLYQRLLLD